MAAFRNTMRSLHWVPHASQFIEAMLTARLVLAACAALLPARAVVAMDPMRALRSE